MSIERKCFRILKFIKGDFKKYKNTTFDNNILLYHRLYDLEMYLNNTIEGDNLKRFIESGNTMNILPVESYRISSMDRYIYKKNKKLLNSNYVNFYATDKLDTDFQNIGWGSTILDETNHLINADRTFNNSKHFLCLMGLGKPHRRRIYDLLSESNLLGKGIISARWRSIYADHLRYDKNILDNYYNNCLFEIVTESTETLVTEKTLKPLLYGVPFILPFLKQGGDFNEKRDLDIMFSKYLEGDFGITLPNSRTLQLIEWFENIGMDINYFDIDYLNLNSIEEKIKELCSMSFKDILETYSDTFKKAKQNQIIIKQKLNKFYETIG